MKNNLKKVITFLILNFSLSSIFYYIIISKGGFTEKDQIYIFGLMLTPGFSVIITKLIYDRSIKGLGWKIGKFKYLAISYLIPLVSAFIVYAFAWTTGIAGMSFDFYLQDNGNVNINKIIFTLTVLFAISFVFALGEELAWRGFLVSELSRSYSYIKTSLIIGIIWSVYHYPLIISGDYNSGGNPWFALVFCTIQMIGVSFIAVWLRLKSGSLWTGVTLHASHNLFIQIVFDPITVNNGITPYIVSEFGIGLAIIYILIAIYCCKKLVGSKKRGDICMVQFI